MPSAPHAVAVSTHHAVENGASGFQAFANRIAALSGSRWTFAGAVGVIAAWAISGPYFHFSDTWQLVINTGTTIVTFLMVFLIQNTQNRDARALHLKMDEMIRALRPADDEMISIEKMNDKELERLSAFYEKVREECKARKDKHRETQAA
jgi:low affinity Fe/Cu permease